MPKYTETRLMSFIDANNNSIDLSDKFITDDDIFDILRFLQSHPHVKTVNLSQNLIGDAGAKEFARYNKTATSVDLSHNKIGPKGATEFAVHNRTVTSVDLSYNKIGPAGAIEFAMFNVMATSVKLKNTEIWDSGARDFAVYNLTATWVDLSNNEISDVGAKDFAENNRKAISVNLSGNIIGDAGAKKFAELNHTATSVDLSNNGITDRGAKDFIVHNHTATSVDFSYNDIDDLESIKGYAEHHAPALSVSLKQRTIGPEGIRYLTEHNTVTSLDLSYPNKAPASARETEAMPEEASSLAKLSLFAIKEGLIAENNGNDLVISPTEPEDTDHLAEPITPNKI
jgi:Leucine-rich repeat (LRR) protein